MLKSKKLVLIITLIVTFSSVFGPNITVDAASGDLLFYSGFESNQTQPTWSDTIDWSINVKGYFDHIKPECSKRSEISKSGNSALMYSGNDTSTSKSFVYFKVFDVNIPVDSDTYLSYWIYPQNENGRCVAVDFIMTDGSNLRDSGAVDYTGLSLHPATARGVVNSWTKIESNIGKWLNGKTIDRILVAYDQPVSQGQFRGYIDDIKITSFPQASELSESVLNDFFNNHVNYYSGRIVTNLDSKYKSVFREYLEIAGGDAFVHNLLKTKPNLKICVVDNNNVPSGISEIRDEWVNGYYAYAIGNYVVFGKRNWENDVNRRVPTLLHETMHHIDNGKISKTSAVTDLYNNMMSDSSKQWDGYAKTNPAEYLACGAEWVLKNDRYNSTETKRERLKRMDPDFYNYLINDFIPNQLFTKR